MVGAEGGENVARKLIRTSFWDAHVVKHTHGQEKKTMAIGFSHLIRNGPTRGRCAERMDLLTEGHEGFEP
jgi:hypothetical protein